MPPPPPPPNLKVAPRSLHMFSQHEFASGHRVHYIYCARLLQAWENKQIRCRVKAHANELNIVCQQHATLLGPTCCVCFHGTTTMFGYLLGIAWNRSNICCNKSQHFNCSVAGETMLRPFAWNHNHFGLWKRVRSKDRISVPECIASLNNRQQSWQSFVSMGL